MGLTGARCVATSGTDGAGGPKASDISEMRRTAKWHESPEEVVEEDYLLVGEDPEGVLEGLCLVQSLCHGLARLSVLGVRFDAENDLTHAAEMPLLSKL